MTDAIEIGTRWEADIDVEPKQNRRTKEEVDMEAAAVEKIEKATTQKSVRRNRN